MELLPTVSITMLCDYLPLLDTMFLTYKLPAQFRHTLGDTPSQLLTSSMALTEYIATALPTLTQTHDHTHLPHNTGASTLAAPTDTLRNICHTFT